MVEFWESSKRQIVEWWNGTVFGAVESSNGGRVKLVELLNRRIVEWWNGTVLGVVEMKNRRMWIGGVFEVVESTIRRVVQWRS